MTRRPEHDEAYRRWLRDIGSQVAAARARMGWTQVRASEQCGLDIKQYQDIEHGRRPISTRTLFAVATGMRVAPEDLTRNPAKHGRSSAVPEGTRSLTGRGWRISEVSGRVKPGRALPIQDISQTAAERAKRERPPISAWAVPPRELHWASVSGAFLAWIEAETGGQQTDGSWCLFRHPLTPPLLGKTVLVRAQAEDVDTTQGYVLRRVGALTLTERGVEMRLEALSGKAPSRAVLLQRETELDAVGELLRSDLG